MLETKLLSILCPTASIFFILLIPHSPKCKIILLFFAPHTQSVIYSLPPPGQGASSYCKKNRNKNGDACQNYAHAKRDLAERKHFSVFGKTLPAVIQLIRCEKVEKAVVIFP